MNLMSLVFSFLTLFLPIGIVVGIVLLVQRSRAGSQHGGSAVSARGVRQFFQYLILFGLLVITVVGIDGLFRYLLEPAEVLFGPDTRLARALSFTLVGFPLAAWLAFVTVRQHRADPHESESPIWALHLTIGALTGLIGTMASTYALLAVLFQAEDFKPSAITSLLVWGALWLGYWLVAVRTLPESHNQPHLILGSFIALATTVVGFVNLLSASADALLLSDVVFDLSENIGRAGALFATGAIAWVWYWFRHAVGSPRHGLWHVLVLPIGVGGGLLMAVVGVSIALWQTLTWFLGDTFSETAIAHFRNTPAALAVALAGLLVWWYHKSLLAPAAERSEINRVHEYIVAAIGLAAAAFGLGTLIVAAIESVTPGTDFGISVMNTLLGAVTLLLVGIPLWWIYWSRCQRAVTKDPSAELVSITRRIYLIAMIGIAGVAAVVSLVFISYTLLVDVVDGSVSLETLRSMRYGLGVLAASAAVSAYHAVVQRADRARGITAPQGTRHANVLLVGVLDNELERRIEHETGARVTAWAASKPDGAWDHDAIVAAVNARPGEDLIVIAPQQVVGVTRR